MHLTQVALYIVVCCAPAKALLQSPSRPHCVFIAYDKVTCHWTPGQNSPADTVYTLEANVTTFDPLCIHSGRHAFSCTRINQTHCSGPMKSPDRRYSVRVVAQHAAESASSPTLCINAFDAVKLRKPDLSDLRAVRDEPRCLELQWHQPAKFALTRHVICAGSVNYQLQYTTDDQDKAQTVEGYLGEHLAYPQCIDSLKTDRTIRLRSPCSFSPFTQYTVRLRQRYHESVWSEWSNQLQSCTGMAAPIAAPQLWRTFRPTDDLQKRHVTLLWKSPQRSQGVCTSLWFNVHCQSDESHSGLQTESCLNTTDTSCQLTLPLERSSCFLTMCNSAGSSPAAPITLPAPTDTPLRAMKTVSLKALNDSSLKVTWSTHTHPSLTGFLLEWELVTKADERNLHWERLDHNTSSVIITDLWSEVRYIVTVRPEFGSEHGEAVSTQTYTRQGVPSAGPRLEVKEQSNGEVLVAWQPPPVEEQHGFITQYSLYCLGEDNATSEVHKVSDETLSYRFTGLSGVYRMYVTAHTVAGAGRASPPQWVTVGNDYLGVSTLVCVVSPVFIVVLFIIIAACRPRLKRNIWPPVPDPALSSLSAWIISSGHTPKSFRSEREERTSTSELTKELYDEEGC